MHICMYVCMYVCMYIHIGGCVFMQKVMFLRSSSVIYILFLFEFTTGRDSGLSRAENALNV